MVGAFSGAVPGAAAGFHSSPSAAAAAALIEPHGGSLTNLMETDPAKQKAMVAGAYTRPLFSST